MENLIVEVNHNKDLFCRITKHQVSKRRKQTLLFSLFFGILSIVLIIADIVSDNMHTMVAGYFFAIFCGVFIFLHIRSSSNSIAKLIDKNIEKYPVNSTYTFFEEKFLVETNFQTSHSTTEYEYSSISKVNRIDEKTLYLLLKNNMYCAIESEKCDDIVSWLKPKISAECFGE